MEIIKTSDNLTPAQVYFLTKAPNSRKMQDLKGSEVEISAWAFYNDLQADPKTGEAIAKEVLSIMTPENEVFGTISNTFIRDFFDMVDCFATYGETVHKISVTSGTSKAGREFITCVYAG